MSELPSVTERSTAWRAATAATGLFLLTLATLMMVDAHDQRATTDQDGYHFKAIEQFAENWPLADFSNYLSATTPGYHWVLAGISTDKTTLRLMGSFFAIALIIALSWGLGRRMPRQTVGIRPAWLGAVLLCLPVMFSIYVVTSAYWLLPDDAAWLGVWLLLLMIWRDRSWSVGNVVLAGVLLFYLVAFRQIHLWLAAGLWASVWLYGLNHRPARSLRSTGWMVLATIPAFLAMGALFMLWGGASPPAMQDFVTGPNPAVGAVVLSLFGLFSVFFIGWLWPALMAVTRQEDGWCWLRRCLTGGLVIGLMLGAIPETTYSMPERFSGIWRVSQLLPTLVERSPAMVLLSVCGGVLAGAWFAVLARIPGRAGVRQSRLWVVILGLFVLANSASAHAWQRYYEPFLLMLLALTVVTLMRAEESQNKKWSWRWVGPGLLALLQIANLWRGMG